MFMLIELFVVVVENEEDIIIIDDEDDEVEVWCYVYFYIIYWC